MTLTTHVLVGLLSGMAVSDRRLALAAGTLFHAALDFLPHRDLDGPLLMTLDGAAAFGLLACVAGFCGTGPVLSGGIGGVLPDLEHLPTPRLSARRPKVFPSHWFAHRARAGRYGSVVELAVVGAAVCTMLTQALQRSPAPPE